MTYGAGGSTRQKTVELVKRLKRESGVEAMAHVTCVGASRDEIAAVLDEVADAGIQNVLALRGDPPAGRPRSRRTPRASATRASWSRSSARARSLALLRRRGGYPEGHVETRDLARDLAT